MDLDLELGDGAGCRRLVEDFRLDGLDLVLGGFFEVFHVVGGEYGVVDQRHLRCSGALQQLQLAQALLEPFVAAVQRLIDRLGRRGEAALQDGEREADGAGAFVVRQRLGTVELLPDVLGDVLVEARFER